MRKFIMLFVCAMCMTAIAKAMPQVIVTECGTQHQIPDQCTDEEAIALLEYWTTIDC